MNTINPKDNYKKFPIIIRIVSFILIVAFLAQDIVWAHPDALQIDLRTQSPSKNPAAKAIRGDFSAKYDNLANKARRVKVTTREQFIAEIKKRLGIAKQQIEAEGLPWNHSNLSHRNHRLAELAKRFGIEVPGRKKLSEMTIEEITAKLIKARNAIEASGKKWTKATLAHYSYTLLKTAERIGIQPPIMPSYEKKKWSAEKIEQVVRNEYNEFIMQFDGRAMAPQEMVDKFTGHIQRQYPRLYDALHRKFSDTRQIKAAISDIVINNEPTSQMLKVEALLPDEVTPELASLIRKLWKDKSSLGEILTEKEIETLEMLYGLRKKTKALRVAKIAEGRVISRAAIYDMRDKALAKLKAYIDMWRKDRRVVMKVALLSVGAGLGLLAISGGMSWRVIVALFAVISLYAPMMARVPGSSDEFGEEGGWRGLSSDRALSSTLYRFANKFVDENKYRGRDEILESDLTGATFWQEHIYDLDSGQLNRIRAAISKIIDFVKRDIRYKDRGMTAYDIIMMASHLIAHPRLPLKDLVKNYTGLDDLALSRKLFFFDLRNRKEGTLNILTSRKTWVLWGFGPSESERIARAVRGAAHIMGISSNMLSAEETRRLTYCAYRILWYKGSNTEISYSDFIEYTNGGFYALVYPSLILPSRGAEFYIDILRPQLYAALEISQKFRTGSVLERSLDSSFWLDNGFLDSDVSVIMAGFKAVADEVSAGITPEESFVQKAADLTEETLRSRLEQEFRLKWPGKQAARGEDDSHKKARRLLEWIGDECRRDKKFGKSIDDKSMIIGQESFWANYDIFLNKMPSAEVAQLLIEKAGFVKTLLERKSELIGGYRRLELIYGALLYELAYKKSADSIEEIEKLLDQTHETWPDLDRDEQGSAKAYGAIAICILGAIAGLGWLAYNFAPDILAYIKANWPAAAAALGTIGLFVPLLATIYSGDDILKHGFNGERGPLFGKWKELREGISHVLQPVMVDFLTLEKKWPQESDSSSRLLISHMNTWMAIYENEIRAIDGKGRLGLKTLISDGEDLTKSLDETIHKIWEDTFAARYPVIKKDIERLRGEEAIMQEIKGCLSKCLERVRDLRLYTSQLKAESSVSAASIVFEGAGTLSAGYMNKEREELAIKYFVYNSPYEEATVFLVTAERGSEVTFSLIKDITDPSLPIDINKKFQMFQITLSGVYAVTVPRWTKSYPAASIINPSHRYAFNFEVKTKDGKEYLAIGKYKDYPSDVPMASVVIPQLIEKDRDGRDVEQAYKEFKASDAPDALNERAQFLFSRERVRGYLDRHIESLQEDKGQFVRQESELAEKAGEEVIANGLRNWFMERQGGKGAKKKGSNAKPGPTDAESPNDVVKPHPTGKADNKFAQINKINELEEFDGLVIVNDGIEERAHHHKESSEYREFKQVLTEAMYIVNDQPRLKILTWLVGLFSPRSPPVEISVAEGLDSNCIKYIYRDKTNPKKLRVRIIFDKRFVCALVNKVSRKNYRNVTSYLLAERLNHELGHSNIIRSQADWKREWMEEFRVILTRDIPMYFALQNNGALKAKIKKFFEEVKPEFPSGHYYQGFLEDKIIQAGLRLKDSKSIIAKLHGLIPKARYMAMVPGIKAMPAGSRDTAARRRILLKDASVDKDYFETLFEFNMKLFVLLARRMKAKRLSRKKTLADVKKESQECVEKLQREISDFDKRLKELPVDARMISSHERAKEQFAKAQVLIKANNESAASAALVGALNEVSRAREKILEDKIKASRPVIKVTRETFKEGSKKVSKIVIRQQVYIKPTPESKTLMPVPGKKPFDMRWEAGRSLDIQEDGYLDEREEMQDYIHRIGMDQAVAESDHSAMRTENISHILAGLEGVQVEEKRLARITLEAVRELVELEACKEVKYLLPIASRYLNLRIKNIESILKYLRSGRARELQDLVSGEDREFISSIDGIESLVDMGNRYLKARTEARNLKRRIRSYVNEPDFDGVESMLWPQKFWLGLARQKIEDSQLVNEFMALFRTEYIRRRLTANATYLKEDTFINIFEDFVKSKQLIRGSPRVKSLQMLCYLAAFISMKDQVFRPINILRILVEVNDIKRIISVRRLKELELKNTFAALKSFTALEPLLKSERYIGNLDKADRILLVKAMAEDFRLSEDERFGLAKAFAINRENLRKAPGKPDATNVSLNGPKPSSDRQAIYEEILKLKGATITDNAGERFILDVVEDKRSVYPPFFQIKKGTDSVVIGTLQFNIREGRNKICTLDLGLVYINGDIYGVSYQRRGIFPRVLSLVSDIMPDNSQLYIRSVEEVETLKKLASGKGWGDTRMGRILYRCGWSADLISIYDRSDNPEDSLEPATAVLLDKNNEFPEFYNPALFKRILNKAITNIDRIGTIEAATVCVSLSKTEIPGPEVRKESAAAPHDDTAIGNQGLAVSQPKMKIEDFMFKGRPVHVKAEVLRSPDISGFYYFLNFYIGDEYIGCVHLEVGDDKIELFSCGNFWVSSNMRDQGFGSEILVRTFIAASEERHLQGLKPAKWVSVYYIIENGIEDYGRDPFAVDRLVGLLKPLGFDDHLDEFKAGKVQDEDLRKLMERHTGIPARKNPDLSRTFYTTIDRLREELNRLTAPSPTAEKIPGTLSKSIPDVSPAGTGLSIDLKTSLSEFVDKAIGFGKVMSGNMSPLEDIAQKTSGKGIVLYADDMVKLDQAGNVQQDAIAELVFMLRETTALNNTKIILYGKDPEKVQLLKKIITVADTNKKIRLFEVTPDDFNGSNKFEEIKIDNEAVELSLLITHVRKKYTQYGMINGDMLGVIRGALNKDRDGMIEEKVKEIARIEHTPVVYFKSDKGIYSFLNAVRALIEIGNATTPPAEKLWAIELLPVEKADIERAWQEYRRALEVAINA